MADKIVDPEALGREMAARDFLERPEQAAPAQEPGFMERFIKPAVLPTAGSIAGAAFGGGVGTPFGMTIPGGIAGASAGSALGEAANQALGITEPSLGQIGMAAAVPAAIGTATALARPLVRMIPTSRAAQTLNALAPDEAAGRLATLEPKIPSRFLFGQATAQRVLIPVNKAVGVIDDMLDDLTLPSKGVQKVNSQAISYLKGLKAKIATQPQGISPAVLQKELEGAGQIIKSIKTRGGSGTGAVKNVFKALIDDLDDVIKSSHPSQPASQTLRTARDVFKREAVIGEMKDSIEAATKVLRGQGANVQFNANLVLKDLGKNEFYKDAFTAAERTEIEGLFKLLNKIPALRPGAGAQFGSGRVAEMVRSGSIGGGIGVLSGGGPGAVVGTAIGTVVPPTVEFAKNLSVAMQMRTGRALMKELLTQSKGVATPQVMSVIAAYARAVETNPELGR